MYIEFRLPTGAGGMAAQHINNILNQELHAWADENNIAYNKKIVKWTVRVTFDNDQHYTLFALTWNPQGRHKNWLKEYAFIEPMRIDKS